MERFDEAILSSHRLWASVFFFNLDGVTTWPESTAITLPPGLVSIKEVEGVVGFHLAPRVCRFGCGVVKPPRSKRLSDIVFGGPNVFFF